MKNKLKNILIPFILMLIFNLGTYYLTDSSNFGGGLNPHMGVLLIGGLFFGPYGAVGSVLGNFLCDSIRGYQPILTVSSALISFAVSYLGYKLWYTTYINKGVLTKPKLFNTHNVIKYAAIILICGFLYSQLHGRILYLVHPELIPIDFIMETRYFLNFVNASLIFGIIGMWISSRIDFIYTPETSNRKLNEKLYKILGILLIVVSIICIIINNSSIILTREIILSELLIISPILVIYLTKPITSKIMLSSFKSIPEDIMNIFQLTTLILIIIGFLLSYDHIFIKVIQEIFPRTHAEIIITIMLLIDIILLIFIIPSLSVLKYVEMKVISPIMDFSKIEEFIHENEKIESDSIVDIYSKYIKDETEIGTLARTYTDLINFNNNYIANIREIEGEKERIKAELDIATKIQAANLPTTSIVNDNFIVNGYSHPAKEVGGDFFDYYLLDDDNLAIVIGDASGKGVPAAILAMICQVIIKQFFKTTKKPCEILYNLNNQLCENNPESMFITLWLGIYNKTTGKIIYSNAGHNPPLIKQNGVFKYLDIDSGIVLGIMENFEFENYEIDLFDDLIIYTDGITDANNSYNDMYGEDRLLNFFNEFKSNDDPIKPLLDDISNFTDGCEQFDDMTLLYLKRKQ
ncbi:MAG: serine/threonine protein phosphatase [Methanobrevibacter thaueri]|nr:serine/threonine protein phosphatase [Methanobrevibacter thaueri]